VAGGIGRLLLQQNLTNTQPTDDTQSAGTHWNTSTIFGLGGAGQTPLSWNEAESDAVAIIQRGAGIRYFDTAGSYGPSEDYLAKCCHRIVQNCF